MPWRQLLAVERMSGEGLWKQALVSLRTLAIADQGQLDFIARRGEARKALECVEELRIRGTQLTIYDAIARAEQADTRPR